MTEATDSLIGSQLGGRYEIVGRVSRGGTAVVYRARDLRLGRTVAVKVIHADLIGDADHARRFDREARAAAILSHPNIVAVFDQGFEGDRSYIVMEYIRGQSLRQIISTSAPLPPTVALTYMDSIAKALSAAHTAGIIHRDIKPENVLITNDGQVKVTDFGLAKIVAANSTSASSGQVMGTMSYMPPEIPRGETPHMSADVYSAGIVLYEMLTGVKPHRSEKDDISEIIYKHINVRIPPPSQAMIGEKAARIPDYLDALVTWCTAIDPDHRPANGSALEEAVAEVNQSMDKGLTSNPPLTRTFLAHAEGEEVPSDAESETMTLPFVRTQEDTPVSLESTPVHPGSKATNHLQPAEEKAPKKSTLLSGKRRMLPLVLLLTVALVAAGVLWWLLDGQWTTTPAGLSGKTEQEIHEIVDPTGLQIEILQEYSETVPVGQSVRTDPSEGERVKRGGTITVYISMGPERYTMPPVVNLTQDAAEQAILDANLAVGAVDLGWSETVPEGSVISASEEEGAQLKKDTPINLVISQGREPLEIASYVCVAPYTECTSGTDAKAALEQAGFVVTTSEENSAKVPTGAVVSQTPSEGTGYRGDTITLVISTGPRMITVPDVTSRENADANGDGSVSPLEAVNALEKAGFRAEAKSVNPAGGNPQLQKPIGTDPAAGTVVAEGSLVLVYTF